MTTNKNLDNVQIVLHYLYPLTVFLYFVVSSVAIFSLPRRFAYGGKVKHKRQNHIWWLLALFIISFGIQLVLQVTEIFSWRRPSSQPAIVGSLYCILVFGIEQNRLSFDAPNSWPPFYGSWLISLILEPVNATILFIFAHAEAKSIHSEPSDNLLLFLLFKASLPLVRFVMIFTVILIYFIWRHDEPQGHGNEESTPLISKPNRSPENSTDSGYGTHSDTTNVETAETQRDDPSMTPGSACDPKNEHGDRDIMISQLKKYKILLQYVWPAIDSSMQLRTFGVGLCLLAGNLLNFLIPRQYGALVDSITGDSDLGIWVQVGIYVVLRMLDSSVGVPLLQELLWLPVQRATDDALAVAAYSHIINLSSAFYDSQSMSSLLTTINTTTGPMNLMRTVLLNTGPSIIDIAVGFAYLSAKFGPYEGFITITTAFAFAQTSSAAIEHMKRTRERTREVIYKVNKTLQDGIFGWYTVVDFNRQSYEEGRYRSVIQERTETWKDVQNANTSRAAVQDLVVMAGLLAGIYLAVYQIRHGEATTGDFVMLLAYWGQVTGPFHSLFSVGRMSSEYLVSIERLVDVLLTKPTVVDKADAMPLETKAGGGTVEFRNVTFGYDKKKNTLQNFNLIIPAGYKVAFVGESGVGKSTILKLLTRRYDVTSGSILIDGQDIRDVTQFSLRDCIGIVPQQPFVFDDTITNNVRYGRLDASTYAIREACKRAAIHDSIMGFEQQYETRVGERGVKLSGGELQRVAIARSALKEPHIIILDEATSALDLNNEMKVQTGLNTLCQGKTTIVVAHRLTTVMDSDIIFVMSEGKMVEQGNHEELLKKGGKYAEMWNNNFFHKPDDEATETTQPLRSKDPRESTVVVEDDRSSIIYPLSSTDVKRGDGMKGTPEEQLAMTPDKHKEEESRLNPGAPEFTPRAMAMLKSIPASPIQNTRAIHIAGADPPKISPSVDMESASFSTAFKVYEESPTRKPKGRTTTPEARETSVEPATMLPEPRLRRNTTQSVSCPEPTQLSHGNAIRSVSQPLPPISPVQSPILTRAATPSNDRETNQDAAYLQPSEKIPDPAVTEVRSSSQGLPRGRGTSRGRHGRGRSRNGRGRRNPSNSKASQSQGEASSGASRPSAPGGNSG